MEECATQEDVSGAIAIKESTKNGTLLRMRLVLDILDTRSGLDESGHTAKNMTKVSNDVIHVTVLVDKLLSWWVS